MMSKRPRMKKLLIVLVTLVVMLGVSDVFAANEANVGSVRIAGPTPTVYVGKAIPVPFTGSVSAVSLEGQGGEEIASVLICPANPDGDPDLQSGVRVATGVILSAAVETRVAPDSPLEAFPGRWWIVLELRTLEGNGEGGAAGMRSVSEGESLPLVCGDGSGMWIRMLGMDLAASLEFNSSSLARSAAARGTVNSIAASESQMSLYLGLGPNPSRGETRFAVRLAEPGAVRLEVFDVRGRRVRGLPPKALPAGESWLVWDGRDDRGASMANGVYFTRVTGAGIIASDRVVLQR